MENKFHTNFFYAKKTPSGCDVEQDVFGHVICDTFLFSGKYTREETIRLCESLSAMNKDDSLCVVARVLGYEGYIYLIY